MVDRTLHGNGRLCGACAGAGFRSLAARLDGHRCPTCRGTGREAVPAAEIIAAQLAENRRSARGAGVAS